jgi:TolA-binding protein
MAEVRILFKKDHFTKVLPLLEQLVEKNYRPAECNYYIGEIKYYRKKYEDALYYFKTSMMLYDKAKYLPKLLLHSAISFERIGDMTNADNFYTTLIEVYPDTKEAKEASKKIQ